MSIVRVHKERDFVTVANRPFRDRRMSWEARGLLGFLLTKPDDWEVDTENLVRESPNAKRDKVLSMLKELEVFGHLHRQRTNDAGGQLAWETIIYESSSLNPFFDPESVAPYPEIPATADSKTRAKSPKVVRADTASPTTAKPTMGEGIVETAKAGMVEGESLTNSQIEGSGEDVSPSTDSPSTVAPSSVYPAAIRKIDLEEILNGRITDEKEILSFVESSTRPLARAQAGVIAFQFWRLHLKHPQAIFNAKRQRAVDDRLKEGYSVMRILLAIRGCKLTPHNMGENDRGEVYDALDLICRNGSQVERFEARALREDETQERLARRAAEAAARTKAAANGGATAKPEAAPNLKPAGEDDRPATDDELEHYASSFFSAMTKGGYKLDQLFRMFKPALSDQEWARVTEIINRRVAEWRAANQERDAVIMREWQERQAQGEKRGGEMTSTAATAGTIVATSLERRENNAEKQKEKSS
jgi:hypothetical protein